MSTDAATQLKFLRNIPLFRDLSSAELALVQEITTLLDCPPSYTLVKEGAVNDSLYFILNGEAGVFRGQEFIKSLRPGDHFGEMALLNEQPRVASVISSRPCSLLVMQKAPLLKLLRENPGLGFKIMWEMARELSTRLDEAERD